MILVLITFGSSMLFCFNDLDSETYILYNFPMRFGRICDKVTQASLHYTFGTDFTCKKEMVTFGDSYLLPVPFNREL